MVEEAAAVLTRMPDLPLAHLALARGAALRGDTVSARVAMTRALRLLPVLDRCYDESAMPRAPSRCPAVVLTRRDAATPIIAHAADGERVIVVEQGVSPHYHSGSAAASRQLSRGIHIAALAMLA